MCVAYGIVKMVVAAKPVESASFVDGLFVGDHAIVGFLENAGDNTEFNARRRPLLLQRKKIPFFSER